MPFITGSPIVRCIATIKLAESVRHGNAQEQDTKSHGDDIGIGPQVELTDPADEEVADDQIEKAPEDIDARRGQALSRRLGEGTLEGAAHYAGDKVRDEINEKRTAEEIADQMTGFHG